MDGSDDYGIDYEVEVFDGGRTTGVTFKVQLKGTDERRDSARAVRVEYATLDYWNELDVPVMLVHYCSPTADVRYRWIQAHDPYFDRQAGILATSIDVRQASPLTPEARARVIAELSFARALKRGERMPLPLPIRLSVETVAAGRSGLIRNALTRLVNEQMRGVIVFAGEESTAFEIRTTDDGLFVSGPAGLHTLTCDVPPEIRRELVPDVIAADCLAALGVLLCHAKNHDAGRRMLLSAARRSAIVVHPLVAQTAAECVTATASPALALAICGRLLAISEVLPAEEFDAAFQLLMAAFITVQSFASQAEYDTYISLLLERCQVLDRQGNFDGAARCAYNASRAFAGKAEALQALRLLQGATLTFDDYPQRAYFHRDVAELCWSLDRRWPAVLAYERAVTIEEHERGHSESRVLLADALVRLGRLEEAKVTLSQWTTDVDAHLNRLAETLQLVIAAVLSVVPELGLAAADSRPAPTEMRGSRGSPDADDVSAQLRVPGNLLDLDLWQRLADAQPAEVGPAAVVAWLCHVAGHRWAWLAILLASVGESDGPLLAAVDSGLELDPQGFLAVVDQLAQANAELHTTLVSLVEARTKLPDPRSAGPTIRINGIGF